MPKRAPDNLASDPDLEEKKRARRRLLGAVVLAGVAAVVLPLFLDSEPRKPAQEVQVEIQPREPGHSEPQANAEPAPVASGTATAVAVTSAGGDPPATKPEDPPAKPEAAPSKPEPAPPKKETAPPKATVNEAKSAEISAKSKPASGGEPAPAKASSSSSTKSVASASPAESFAVQIGAFASEKGAKEQAARAGKTGLKVYTERIKTSSGVRIRVRVGPFKTREQAEAARVKLRAAGIESAIIAP